MSYTNAVRDCFQSLTCVLVLSLAATAGRGQAPTAGATKPGNPPDYSKEAFVIESLRTVASFENDGTETRETAARVKVQSQAGVQQWGLLTLGYSSANEQVEIGHVRVYKADGTVVETTAADVQDMTSDVTRIAPLYSDYREKHVAVKGLGAGDVLEYQFTNRLHTPLIPGQFWFAYDFYKAGIALAEEVEVSVPKDREVKVKSPDLKPAVREEGSHRVYTWKSANRERKEDEEPTREVPPPAIQISTFKSWEEVGRWWSGLEQERVAPTPEIRAKAAELTKDAKTYEEKVRALYNYVATRFRYISISFGIGRYQPHAAAEVLKNEYGDCKDKHTLLASLLEAAGIEAYPALVNSVRKIDPDVPSPGQFDHVISVVPQSPRSNKLVWLDTTTEIAPMGWLVPSLRDKEGLVVIAGKFAPLIKTPADSPFRNSLVFELEGKLDSAGTLEAKVERSDRGDLEVVLRAAFRQVPQTQWKDLVQRLSYMSGFSGDVSEVTASAPEATDQPFRFSYKYLRKEYPDWANRRISPPWQLCSLVQLKNEAAKSPDPLKLGGPGEYECKSKIELPKGYTPGLLPAADMVRDFAEYHSSYSFKDGVFGAERRLTLKVRELPSTRRSDYISLQKAVADDGSLLTSFNMGTTDLRAQADQMSADELNTAAANLLDQNKDWVLARDLLLKATLKDPHHKWAWNNLGRAYAALGNTDEAVRAYQQQIEINPHDEYAYKGLGWVYAWMKRYDDAVKAYRKHAEINPGDKDVYGYIGSTLGAMEKWGEAAQAYEKYAALNPDRPYSYTQWAHALMKSGKTDEARKQLDRALELDSGPMTLNAVAWERAEAGVDLDQAEEEAKSAVDKTASNLGGPLSFDVPADYSQKLSSLGAYLDTLGWVLFQKGRLDEAEPYLLSAYQLETSSTVAEHMARLRARQDKFEEAVRYYAYSQATMDGTGHADKELEDYVTKKSGGTGPLMSRVTDLKGTFLDQHNVTAPGGSFAWPENSTATKASFAQVVVVVDAAGVVTDAQLLSGNESFKDSALADARKLRLPTITWPGHALPTVRTIAFLYLAPSMKSSEKRVKAAWALGKPPAGSTQTSVPDYMADMLRGETLRKELDLEGAISNFRLAIQAEPDCVKCHRVLADTLAQKGYRALAIAEYKEVVRIEPDNADEHFMLGAQFEAEGATKAYNGYHFDAKSRTGLPGSSTLSKSARANYESALEQYRLAHKLAPDNESYKEAYERIKRQLRHP